MDEVICQGTDGSVFQYHAVKRADVDPPLVSWVLVLESADTPLDPQRVSASEVVGDMVSMTIAAEDARGIVHLHTERMLAFARDQLAQATDPADSPQWQEIVSRLEHELEELQRGDE